MRRGNGTGGGDARGVGDGAGHLVLRDIKIDAHEHAFAAKGEVTDGFEFGHDVSRKKLTTDRTDGHGLKSIHPRYP
jgi:hypothetical protein